MMMMMMMMIIMFLMMMTTETLIMIGSVPLTLMILVMLMTLEMAMATNMMMFEPLIIVSPSDRTQLASRLGERARANACVHVRMHACVGRLFAGTCSQQHCSRRTCGVIENLILDQLILAIVWWMFFSVEALAGLLVCSIKATHHNRRQLRFVIKASHLSRQHGVFLTNLTDFRFNDRSIMKYITVSGNFHCCLTAVGS